MADAPRHHRLPFGSERRSARISAAGLDPTSVKGTVERVTFHNPDNGFCVLRITLSGRREPLTVVGHAATIAAGEEVSAVGEWINDLVHGLQFRASSLHTAPPNSQEGIERYLGSGMIRGIGPHFAKRLVEAFGVRVFDVIDATPEKLRDVEGIGRTRAAQITDAWTGQKAIRDIMVFLYGHGVGTSRAVRIYKTYGADSIARITENPYRLAREIRGIGFLTADALAKKLGIEQTAAIRVQAGISHALAQALDDGQCGLPRDELVEKARELLDVPQDLVTEALEAELRAGTVVADTVEGQPCVFLSWLHTIEQHTARRLRFLADRAPAWPPIAADKALEWVETKLGLTLADLQHEAVRRAVAASVLVITGGPGVGKTTIVRAILAILNAKRIRVTLCAPTGRAAKRMSELTGIEAKTIHRLLEVNPADGQFRRGPGNPVDGDCVVVDEVSMVDVPLMHALTRALPDHASLILVGDVDQLPSVGPGNVLGDIIASGVIPVVRLTEVFRQAALSRIIVNAHRINRGEMPELENRPADVSDFYFVEAETPEECASRIVQLVSERIPQRFGLQPVRDIQVLCPMNRGVSGARSLNVELQRVLNPGARVSIQRFGSTFAAGDKVMQIENDYDRDVYNGDIGFIRAIDEATGDLDIEFDGRRVMYATADLDQVVLAYATTVHKAQGSEYPAVVMPVTTQHYPMLQRNLIYTGLTRGKKLVVIVGQKKALAMAVKGTRSVKRWSRLREWLTAAGNP